MLITLHTYMESDLVLTCGSDLCCKQFMLTCTHHLIIFYHAMCCNGLVCLFAIVLWLIEYIEVTINSQSDNEYIDLLLQYKWVWLIIVCSSVQATYDLLQVSLQNG